MKCEWAEGNLSAYLDNTLDPPTRAEVNEHLATCPQCATVLADFRRYDALITDTIRIAPPENLRDRLFASPEFTAILRSSAQQADHQPSKPTLGSRWRPPTPNAVTQSAAQFNDLIKMTSASAADHPAAPVEAVTEAPATETPTGDPGAPPRGRRQRRPLVSGALLSVAAALILALGVSLLFRQGFLPFGRSSGQPSGQITTLHNAPDFSTTPLAAGPRLVFAQHGALWSAPEAGPSGAPGAAQRLTSPSVSVVAWSVAPIAAGHGGTQIVYIDGRTGALHLTRSDRQADQIIGAVTVAPTHGQTVAAAFWASATGRAIRASLRWSPTGAQIAYLTATANGASLAVATLTVPAAPADPFGVQTAHNVGGAASPLAWSADGAWLAFAQSAASGQSLWLFNATTGSVRQLTASADPLHPTATVARLAIAQSAGFLVVTWAAADGATISGVFAQGANVATPARLTPAGARFTAADVTATGEWLLGDGATLASVASFAPTGGATTTSANLQPLATLAAPAQALSWSPSGGVVAVVANGDLSLWSPTAGLTHVASGVTLTPTPAWSADGHTLAFLVNDLVTTARIANGRATTLTALGRFSPATVLRWSPDGALLAIATRTGALLAASDGSHATQVATAAVDDGALAWSIAG